tara:strand:- start:1824 stop:2465 length:642 start_codon:yes stop_codon:yes gene_type:complete
MTIKEWDNLIILSESNPNLVGTILTGMVDEFIDINNPSKQHYNFNLTKSDTFIAEVEFIKCYSFHSKNGGMQERKLKRGSKIKPKNYKAIDYFPRKSSIEKWHGVSIWDIRSLVRKYNGKLLKKTPVDGLWQLKIPNFRLRFNRSKDVYHCRIQVKYKLSNTKNELFNIAFDKADRYPKKGKYVNFIEFNIDKEPEETLWHLAEILKQWNCKK